MGLDTFCARDSAENLGKIVSRIEDYLNAGEDKKALAFLIDILNAERIEISNNNLHSIKEYIKKAFNSKHFSKLVSLITNHMASRLSTSRLLSLFND